jgi:hypothetical protein
MRLPRLKPRCRHGRERLRLLKALRRHRQQPLALIKELGLLPAAYLKNELTANGWGNCSYAPVASVSFRLK